MQLEGLFENSSSAGPKAVDRVRRNSSPEVNNRIDEAMMKRLWAYSRKSKAEITARIAELDREWDLERVAETGAATLSLTGVVLGFVRTRLWLLMPAAVLASLLQHSLTRRSTFVQTIRALGVRTRREIDAERYALRMIRGDFDKLQAVSEDSHKAIEALRLSRS